MRMALNKKIARNIRSCCQLDWIFDRFSQFCCVIIYWKGSSLLNTETWLNWNLVVWHVGESCEIYIFSVYTIIGHTKGKDVSMSLGILNHAEICQSDMIAWILKRRCHQNSKYFRQIWVLCFIQWCLWKTYIVYQRTLMLAFRKWKTDGKIQPELSQLSFM